MPNGLEKVIKREISLLLKREKKKRVRREILNKYLGKFQGNIDEEEWSLQ